MADIGNDVFFATIPELNARLKSKEFSAQELARAFASRLAQLGGRYNALALPLPHPLVTGERAQRTLAVVRRELYTTFGFRSLEQGNDPDMPRNLAKSVTVK